MSMQKELLGKQKHGPLALMDKNAVVFVLNPDDRTYSDMLSSAYQVKARGAKIIGISNVPNDIYDAMIRSKIDNDLYPLVEIIPCGRSLTTLRCY